jgi:hypothetical protein
MTTSNASESWPGALRQTYEALRVATSKSAARHPTAAQIACLAASLPVIFLASRVSGGLGGRYLIYGRIDTAVGVLGFGSLLLILLQNRWRYTAQSIFIAVFFVICKYKPESPRDSMLDATIWVLGALLVWKLPLAHRSLRKAIIASVTAAFMVAWPYLTKEQGNLLLQFLFACEVLGPRARSWSQCQRAMSAPVGPIPPDQMLGADHSPARFWVGTIWIVGALTCAYVPEAFQLTRQVASRNLVYASLVARFLCILQFVADHFIFAGFLKILGLPIQAPLGSPARMTTFVELWKLGNTWRFSFLRRVYIDNFFPLRRDAWGVVSILLVFLISGVQHLPGLHPRYGETSLTAALHREEAWIASAMLVGTTYYWILYELRRRYQSVAKTGVESPKAGGPFRTAASVFLVNLIEGFRYLEFTYRGFH